MTHCNGPESRNYWSHSIAAVAFDMDGLLVNTETLYSEVGDTLLQRRGSHFTTQLKDKMMGLPGPEAFSVMIEHENLSDSIEELQKESEAIFEHILPQKLALLPGVLELLEFLDQIKMPRCIATSSSHNFARQVLELTGLEGRFSFVVTAADVPQGKPAPDIYQAAARRLGAETSRVLVLEDSHHGSQAGVGAGACTVAVPGEHSVNHAFPGVAFVAESLKDQRIRALLEA